MAIDLAAIRTRRNSTVSDDGERALFDCLNDIDTLIAEVERLGSVSGVIQDDMQLLMKALGIAIGARDASPHNVMLDEVIPAACKLRSEVERLQICSIDYHVAVNATDADGVVRCACGSLRSDAADLEPRLEIVKAQNRTLLARTQKRWIPVTERLPEDDADVLAGSRDHVEAAYYSGGAWDHDESFPDPTHWMPLPEPPR